MQNKKHLRLMASASRSADDDQYGYSAYPFKESHCVGSQEGHERENIKRSQELVCLNDEGLDTNNDENPSDTSKRSSIFDRAHKQRNEAVFEYETPILCFNYGATGFGGSTPTPKVFNKVRQQDQITSSSLVMRETGTDVLNAEQLIREDKNCDLSEKSMDLGTYANSGNPSANFCNGLMKNDLESLNVDRKKNKIISEALYASQQNDVSTQPSTSEKDTESSDIAETWLKMIMDSNPNKEDEVITPKLLRDVTRVDVNNGEKMEVKGIQESLAQYLPVMDINRDARSQIVMAKKKITDPDMLCRIQRNREEAISKRNLRNAISLLTGTNNLTPENKGKRKSPEMTAFINMKKMKAQEKRSRSKAREVIGERKKNTIHGSPCEGKKKLGPSNTNANESKTSKGKLDALPAWFFDQFEKGDKM